MKDLFHIIEDAQIVMRQKGIFYQKKLYRRGDRLYAGWGTGFIRIGGRSATSQPNVSWGSMDLPSEMVLINDEFGNPRIQG